MTHPITPPPELVQQWNMEGRHQDYCTVTEHIATRAAQWGADQELEAIQKEIIMQAWFADPRHRLAQLRAARRPKPPSLKERALMALEDGDIGPGASLTPVEVCIIRRALESINE